EARERAPGKSWGPPLSLSVAADHVASLDLVRTGNRVACVWSRFDGQNLIAQAALRDPKTGGWSNAESLSVRGHDALAPRVALDARGDATVVWATLTDGGWTIQSAYRPAG